MRLAADTADGHAVTFVDNAADTDARTGNDAVLAAAARAVDRIAAD